MSDQEWEIRTGDAVEEEAEELGVVEPGAAAVARLAPATFPKSGVVTVKGKVGLGKADQPFSYRITVGGEGGGEAEAPDGFSLGHDHFNIDAKKVYFVYATPLEEGDERVTIAVDSVTHAAEGAAKEPEAAPAAPEPKPEAKEPEAKPAEAKPAAEPKSQAEAAAAGGKNEVLIEAQGLSKYYRNFTAIEDVSFEVRRGEVVAFLGPNGAGKSTTMKILTGVLAPDAGEARIAGMSVVHNRIEVARRLGYLPENGPLYEEMTPEELLRFLGEARGLSPERLSTRIAELVERLGLETVKGKAVHKLSKGYRQRVGLAQALLHSPDVLIMDEPTSGLDPNQIQDVRRIIRGYAGNWTPEDPNDDNKAILLSTHILQEVEAVADRVVFINKGRIVFQGTVEELRAAGDTLDEAFAAKTGYSTTSWTS